LIFLLSCFAGLRIRRRAADLAVRGTLLSPKTAFIVLEYVGLKSRLCMDWERVVNWLPSALARCFLNTAALIFLADSLATICWFASLMSPTCCQARCMGFSCNF